MTGRKPNWQDEGLTPGSVLNDRDLADFSRLTAPFSQEGRWRSDEYKTSGIHPKEFLDDQKQRVLEDMVGNIPMDEIDTIPEETKNWLMQRRGRVSPLTDHPDMPPGEDDGRY
jgi:hypothetical protein